MAHSLTLRVLIASLVASVLAVTGCVWMGPIVGSTSPALAVEQLAAAQEITMFRSPTCSCCGAWIKHMESAGFRVKDNIVEDMAVVKEQYGVPEDLTSCHTALIGGYVVEGHVPSEDVQRLLAEKPDVAGITVPGMPIGSPGMESGDSVEAYTVFSFTGSGEVEAFAEHL